MAFQWLRKAVQLISDLVNINDLKVYLSMPDAGKGRDLAASFGRDFLEYLEGAGEEELAVSVSAEIEKNEFLDWSFLEPLPDKAFVGFYRNVPPSIGNDPHSPSYLHMSYVDDVNNEWLIHGTNDATAIESKGFTRGAWDYTTLGLTRHFVESVKSGGFNFALFATAFDEETILGYGKEAVVFRASGIQVFHYGDNQPQVIFVGNTAHSINGIYRSSYGDYYTTIDGEEFSGSMGECANWIIKNST